MDVITAARAVLLDEEEALAGNTTISLETQEDLANEESVLAYFQDNFAEFLTVLRNLSKEDQEMLLSYYALGKTQTILAGVHRTTQTLCSLLLRRALERVGLFMMMGKPTVAMMAEIFSKNNLENPLPGALLSEMVEMYSKERSFQKVADKYNLHRPDIRRAMRNAASSLGKSGQPREKALGAYLDGLLEKASASGQGLTARQKAKQGHIYHCDPAVLGKFRVDVQDPDFAHLFTSRANN